MVSLGNYYDGDLSGYSIALSDESGDVLTVVIGAPNNMGADGYYNGHVRIYQSQITNPSWQTISNGDLDGPSEKESMGWSVSMNQAGSRFIVGSPFYGESSSFYYRGAARVYGIEECTDPPSNAPSNAPSAISETVNRVCVTWPGFNDDDYGEWCMTAKDATTGPDTGNIIHIRPCNSTKFPYQLWTRLPNGQIRLATVISDALCLETSSTQVYINNCDSDKLTQNFTAYSGQDNLGIKQEKNGKLWYLGFEPEQKFSRISLYRAGSLNPTLPYLNLESGFAEELTESLQQIQFLNDAFKDAHR